MYTYTTIQEVSLPELEMWSFIYESNPPLMTGSVSMSSEKQAHTHTHNTTASMLAWLQSLRDADVFYSKNLESFLWSSKIDEHLQILTPLDLPELRKKFWCGASTKRNQDGEKLETCAYETIKLGSNHQ